MMTEIMKMRFSTFPLHERRPTEMQYIYSPDTAGALNVFAFMVSICATVHLGDDGLRSTGC